MNDLNGVLRSIMVEILVEIPRAIRIQSASFSQNLGTFTKDDVGLITSFYVSDCREDEHFETLEAVAIL